MVSIKNKSIVINNEHKQPMTLFMSTRYKRLIHFILCILFLSSNASLLAQDSTKTTPSLFQGKITYLYQIINPNKGLISDEEFYREMPNGGKSNVVLYLRGNQYKWEYDDRIELYLPAQNQIAIYLKKKSDSIYFAPANIADELLEKLEKSNLTKKLLSYDLSAYTAYSKWDTRTFFYNPTVLKTNAAFWKNHKREYLGDFISKSGSFPMIIHQKSLLGNWIMAVTKIEPMTLTDDIFQLPKR